MAFKKLTKDEREYWTARVNRVFGQYKSKISESIDIKQTTLADVHEEYMAECRHRFEEALTRVNQDNFEGKSITIYAPTLKDLGRDESYNRCMKIKEICKPMKARKDEVLFIIGKCSSQEDFDKIINFVKECRDYEPE